MTVFVGEVVKGKFIPDSPSEFGLAYCEHEGKRVVVNIGRYHQKRSNAQNKYFWAVPIKLISAKTGYTPEQAHDAIVNELHYELCNGKNGQAIKVPKPTRNLTTVEFMELIAKIQHWADEFFEGLYIPSPNESGYEI